MSVFTDGPPPRVKYVRPRYYSASLADTYRWPRVAPLRAAGKVVGVALVRKRQRVVCWAVLVYARR